tara:strand:+ start:379 stop:798 length:420 start_codon:yes stop_codon:yes gene_type:complete
LLPKPTPKRVFEVVVVALSKEDPLSVDFTMVPLSPATTNTLLPNATPYRLFDVGVVALSKEDPLFVDLRIFPERPAKMNTPFPERLSVVAVLSLELDIPDESSLPPQEMMTKPKPVINKVYKIILINFLNKNNKQKVKK